MAAEMLWRGVAWEDASSVLTPWVSPSLLILWAIILIDIGHLISPIIVAWTTDGFRALMVRRPLKYVVLPLVILALAGLAGWVGSEALRFDPVRMALISNGPLDYRDPFAELVYIYLFWNAYHFSMQAFGIMSIYRRKAGSGRSMGGLARLIDKTYCCAVIWAALLVPRLGWWLQKLNEWTGWPPGPEKHGTPMWALVPPVYFWAAVSLIIAMLAREWLTARSLPRAALIVTNGLAMVSSFWVGLWSFAIIALSHWLQAVGLASHIQANHKGMSVWVPPLGFMLAGALLFAIMFIDPRAALRGGISLGAVSFAVPAVSLSMGLSFVHFLYDRWIYKLSAPAVRATIGAAIFVQVRHAAD